MLRVTAIEQRSSRALEPVYLALRVALRRYVGRRVRAQHIDDLVQDILMRMHEHAGDLRDEQRLAGWAFRIARSVVVDHHRALGKEHARADSPYVEAEGIAAQEIEESNANEVVAGWLRPMLGLLPDEYAQALELIDVQGMSQREYAERAGLSLSGAKSRVQRGRRMLEEIVRACCDLELDSRGNVVEIERRSCRPNLFGCEHLDSSHRKPSTCDPSAAASPSSSRSSQVSLVPLAAALRTPKPDRRAP